MQPSGGSGAGRCSSGKGFERALERRSVRAKMRACSGRTSSGEQCPGSVRQAGHAVSPCLDEAPFGDGEWVTVCELPDYELTVVGSEPLSGG